jgi:glutamate-1-semialdehyde 2,1-aminomutase
MERIAPAGDVYQAGTLSGNPLATAAGLATLSLLDDSAYAQLDRLTRAVAEGIEGVARGAGVAASVAWTTGLLTLFFAPHPPRNYDEARACDLEAHAAFCRGMLDRGIYLPPSQFEAWFPSLAHGDEHVERTLAAAHAVLGEL